MGTEEASARRGWKRSGLEDNWACWVNGRKKTFLGIEGVKECTGDEMGSDVKQIGKEWHRVVPAEFQLLEEHSCILYMCFNSSMSSFFLPFHCLLFKWEEKWPKHRPAFVAKGRSRGRAARRMALPGSLRRQPASRGLVSHCTHHHIVVFLLTFFR